MAITVGGVVLVINRTSLLKEITACDPDDVFTSSLCSVYDAAGDFYPTRIGRISLF